MSDEVSDETKTKQGVVGGSIYDPPSEVWCLAYQWERGGASSGEQRLFKTSAAALAHLDATEGVRETGAAPVVLWRLTAWGESSWAWERVGLRRPEGWRLVDPA